MEEIVIAKLKSCTRLAAESKNVYRASIFATTTRVGRRTAIRIGESSSIPSHARPNPITEALRLKALLDGPPKCTKAMLARMLGITRARVSQLTGLLRLPQPIQDYVHGLGRVHGRVDITERELRPIAALRSSRRQMQAFQDLRCRKGLPARRPPVA